MTFTKASYLGSGRGKISLSGAELFKLLHKCFLDLGWNPGEFGLEPMGDPFPDRDYYRIGVDWFSAGEDAAPKPKDLLPAFDSAVSCDQDFKLYFHNLCALHKRRVKYRNILRAQPRPSMDQIGQRSLLEYGVCDDEFLATWMIWRKWVYDIDNRSGQETGYLFEPILASCLGGITIGAKKSKVKRLDEAGRPTSRGRQVDCYCEDGDEKLAYEFKLRVSIAASGQGRFGEELSFPEECRAAGFKPMLVVLSPSPSDRLEELSEAFVKAGSEPPLIGDRAWAHMEEKAGPIMSKFLEIYIRPPLTRLAALDNGYPEPVRLKWEKDAITIETERATYKIERSEEEDVIEGDEESGSEDEA